MNSKFQANKDGSKQVKQKIKINIVMKKEESELISLTKVNLTIKRLQRYLTQLE